MSGKASAVSVEAVRKKFGSCYDYNTRELIIGGAEGTVKCTLCYLDGLVSSEAIAGEIIKPVTNSERFRDVELESEAIELFLSGAVYTISANRRITLSEVIDDMLEGFCAIVFDKAGAAVTFEVRSSEKRSIDEPKEEKVVKGSKDVFIEILKINSMLVRRKLKNSSLRFRQMSIGDKTNTTVVITYIENYTNMKYVDELEKRLKYAKIDSVITTASIEEYISDRPSSPFPQLLRTERPDRFCMNLLEGRVGLLIDGLPMGFLAPATFSQFFKVPEDNAKHYIIASTLTILRYAALVIALLLPALYVAIAMFHQEMLPTRLLMSIIESRQAVPFPTAIEVVCMLAAFELIQEAGVRLPSTIGETVSIIGALIVGQSAVEAKVVSPIVVIVVALSGIAGYTVPDQDMSAALRIFRAVLVLAAIVAGLFGIVIGCILIVYYLCTMESFGVGYMQPFSSSSGSKAQALLRLPITKTNQMAAELRPVRKGRRK